MGKHVRYQHFYHIPSTSREIFTFGKNENVTLQLVSCGCYIITLFILAFVTLFNCISTLFPSPKRI